MGLHMLGPTEVLLIIGVALLLFGPGRIAGVGKSLGEGIRLFKAGLKGDEESGEPLAPRRKPRAEPANESKDSEEASESKEMSGS